MAAADILHDRVFPFYERHGISIEHFLTDNGKENCGTYTRHPYETLLELYDIKHRRARVATPRTNGFFERFNRTILDEYFRVVFRRKFFSSLEELQADLDVWIDNYSNECPHRGYRNMGRRPIETFEMGKKVLEETKESGVRIRPKRG